MMTDRLRSRILILIVCSALSVLLWVANQPMKYETVGSFWFGRHFQSAANTQALGPSEVVHAGWPNRYYTKISLRNPERDLTEHHRPLALVWNALVALVLVGAAGAFVHYRQRRIAIAGDPERVQAWFDRAAAMGAILAPVAALGWLAIGRVHESRALRNIHLYGGGLMVAEVPTWAVDRLPSILLDQCYRAHDVALVKPPRVLLKEINALPHMRTLTLLAPNLPVESYDNLARNRLLYSLHLYRAKLDDAQVAAMAGIDSIRYLELPGCLLSRRQWSTVASMPLLHLDMRRTGVDPARLEDASFSDSLMRLSLTAQPSDEPQTLRLVGWPHLRSLTLESDPLHRNPVPVRLVLQDLEALKDVAINRMQRYDLILHDAPLLARFMDSNEMPFVDLFSTESVPGHNWFGKLDIRNAPSLTELDCYATDLEELSLVSLPQLEVLRLGAFSYDSETEPRLEDVKHDSTQDWITQIGTLSNLRNLDLSGLPVTGCDLQPLGNLKTLTQLELRDSQVEQTQLAFLRRLTMLQNLDLGECELTNDFLGRVLNSHPDMTNIRCNLSELESITIRDNLQLRHVQSPRMAGVGDVTFVNLRRYAGQIELAGSPRSLHIENMPRLKRLVIGGEWPQNAFVGKLPQLSVFAAGGKNVDDQVLDQLEATRLDHLTIAYGNLSRDCLRRIGRFDRLTELNLPGANLDDDITKSWRRLSKLRSLCLDDTTVDEGTLSWLQRIPVLRRLHLDRVKLSQAALEALASLSQLSELSIENVPVPVASLEGLMAVNTMERINLTGCDLTEDHWEAMMSTDAMTLLVCDHESLTANIAAKLLENNSKLMIDARDRRVELRRELIHLHGSDQFAKRIYLPEMKLFSEPFTITRGRQMRQYLERQGLRHPVPYEFNSMQPISYAAFRSPKH
ncbi:MAG: hypothetical protein AAGD07_18870 [Planctomycetota bacterium]